MGMTLAIVSQKGGVGKTTLAANLAAAFADLNFRTLLIEVDPQGGLIRNYGIDRYDLHHGLFGCVTARTPASEAVAANVLEQLDLIPSNVWSHEEEARYLTTVSAEPTAIRAVVRELADDYDYVVLDGPPALGPLTRAAMIAADRYLVPVQAEAVNLSTIARLEQLASDVRAHQNPELRLEGYVVTMADLRTRHAGDVIQKLSADYPRDLLQTIVPRSIRVADEAVRGRPTVRSAPSSRVGKALQSLAEEILSRHSRERAADRAELLPDAQETDDLAAWERVLADMPDDAGDRSARSIPSSGNGHGGWGRD